MKRQAERHRLFKRLLRSRVFPPPGHIHNQTPYLLTASKLTSQPSGRLPLP